MKCEICHKNEAETALKRGGEDPDDEIYVCKACAKEDRIRRQKKSQRTRKVTGLPPGVEMSITRISSEDEGDGEEPPPIVAALMNAFGSMVDDIEKAKAATRAEEKAAPVYETLPVARVAAAYRVRNGLHLEGLHLIGELDAVRRALHALEMDLVGISADGVHDVAHVYELRYAGSVARARRVAEDLLAQERNARVRLVREMPRVFADSLGRALAILKNCRLLSAAELCDLLSPLRLGALDHALDGVTLREIERLMGEQALDSSEDKLAPDERDRVDGERADEMNDRFEDVVLNEKIS